MKGVLALLLTLLITLRLQYVAADCNSPKQYNTTFIPACDQKDLIVKWPNYEDTKSYYACYGVNNPKLMQCSDSQYFCFVLQTCGPCEKYIPAIDCPELPTEKEANCVNMTTTTPTPPGGETTTGSSTEPPTTTGLPTPNYPDSTTASTTVSTTTASTTTASTTTASTTTASTTTASTTTASTTPSTTTPSGPTPPTPPTSGPTSPTDIPPISSPVTVDPSVPLPPTPPSTPPSVPLEPPTVAPVPNKKQIA